MVVSSVPQMRHSIWWKGAIRLCPSNYRKRLNGKWTRQARAGTVPFEPELMQNKKGVQMIRKEPVTHGPKKGKIGYVHTKGRIWIKDRAHAGDPDHWDVQVDGGKSYFRVDLSGNMLS
jgi:hypothetical protein